eukprot:131809-Prorocentrum_minimum.AAC.1
MWGIERTEDRRFDASEVDRGPCMDRIQRGESVGLWAVDPTREKLTSRCEPQIACGQYHSLAVTVGRRFEA